MRPKVTRRYRLMWRHSGGAWHRSAYTSRSARDRAASILRREWYEVTRWDVLRLPKVAA